MPDPDRTIFLIDGHAQIFRAYFAIRSNLTSPTTGEPTGAVYAFAGMLVNLFTKYQPKRIAMAIDTHGKTFRDEIYPEYKATRESPPDDFFSQEQRIFDLVKLFGIPIVGVEGAEADDIIATTVEHVLNDPALEDHEIMIFSKDKDLEQLLGPRVSMYDLFRDEHIDVDWLKEKRDIRPDQVADLLALMGDKVDNIPGVEGIGPKTASKLLSEFGSIDAIYDNLDQIKGKRKENLEAARDHMDLSRQLVALKRDVDLPVAPDEMLAAPIQTAAVKQMFDQLGFSRYKQELDKIADEQPEKPGEVFADSLFGNASSDGDAAAASGSLPAPPGYTTAEDFDYRAITTEKELDETVDAIGKVEMLAVDTETIGLGADAGLCGVCLAWEADKGVYIPTASPHPQDHLDEKTVLEKLRPVLEDPAVPKCGHNLKYDLRVLGAAGVTVRGAAFDSMIAAALLASRDLGRSLTHVAYRVLKHQMMSITELIGPKQRGKEQRTMDQVPLEQVTPYAAEDADISLKLVEPMRAMLEEDGMTELAERVEMPLVAVLAKMEQAGIRVDPKVLDQQREALQQRIDELRREVMEKADADFNLDSPKQLAEVLFEKLKMPVVKKTKTGQSTDIEVLEKLAELEEADRPESQVPGLVIEYRQLTKLVGTYLANLGDCIEDDGRIHAQFHQAGAATGRLSSSDPNLQNIPIRTEVGRKIRAAFVAEPDHRLIAADYSQIELRVLAHLSEDEALIDAFAKDLDIHTAVASEVFKVALDDVTSEQRASAKVINFGIVYGVTAYGLARRIDGLDVDEAKQLIEDYRKRFSGIDRFLQKCIQQATDLGYVTTIMGRRRPITQIQSQNGNERSLGERLAINSVVQGSAADLIKLAMVNLDDAITQNDLPMQLLLQIHDELVVEAPKGDAEAMADRVQSVMESAMDLKVPLKTEVNIGESWLEAK